MNKMTKGALATGLGVALLIGGGGSLAVWNTSAQANAGTIVAGDLGLEAGAGTWRNSAGTDVTEKVQGGKYKIVPGDSLTFTQPVTVELSGEMMKAKLSVTGAPQGTFTQGNYDISGDVVDANGNTVFDQILTKSGSYIASATFTFKEGTTGVQDTGASYDFSNIAYKLDQVASSSNPTTAP